MDEEVNNKNIKKSNDDYILVDCSSLTKLMHLWVDCFVDVDESDYHVAPTCYGCTIKVGKRCVLKPCDCRELFTQKEPFVHCDFSGNNRELNLIIRSMHVTKEDILHYLLLYYSYSFINTIYFTWLPFQPLLNY